MPSKPASNNNQTTTQSTQVQLPSWLEDLSRLTANRAQIMGGEPGGGAVQPLPQYQVAPITAPGQADIGFLQGNVGSTNPAFASAQQGAQGVMGFDPSQVTAGSLANTDLTPYLNPFTQNVIDKTMPLIDQQRQAANNQTADLAAKTGAFGGSRQGVAEGVNNAQSGLYAGQLGAQLNQANFGQAQGAAQADIARNLAAQEANQTAGLQGGQLNLQGAQQLGALTGAGQQSYLQSLMAALGGQQQLQTQSQAQLDAPRQDQMQRLQLMESAAGSVPYGTTQTTTGTGPGATSNPWLTGLGALGTGVSIAGSLFGPAGLFAAAPAAAAAGGGSDRNLKTDIKRVGTDEATDLPIYAYRYKGDPKTYPKMVGPMAQDIERRYPDQVAEVGGKKVVNAAFLTGMMARARDTLASDAPPPDPGVKPRGSFLTGAMP